MSSGITAAKASQHGTTADLTIGLGDAYPLPRSGQPKHQRSRVSVSSHVGLHQIPIQGKCYMHPTPLERFDTSEQFNMRQVIKLVEPRVDPLRQEVEELNRKAGEARRFSLRQRQQTVPNIVWKKQRSHDQKSGDLLPESRVPTVPAPKSRNIDDFAMLTAEVAARLDSLPDLQILHSVQRNPGRATLEAQIATHASRSGPVTRPSPTELEQLGGRLQASIWMRQLKYSVVEVCGEPSSSTLL